MDDFPFLCFSCHQWAPGSSLGNTFCDQCVQLDLLQFGMLSGSSEQTTNYNTPSYSSSDNSLAGSPKEREDITPIKSRKRRHASESSEDMDQALVRVRKPRKLADPNATAKVREEGACFQCKKEKKRCTVEDDPNGSCQRCLKHADQIMVTFIPGLLRPVCWRPNISTELFRRGPTIDFAVSLRGNIEDAGPGKQAQWRHFSLRKSGHEGPKTVELSQGWTSNALRIQVDRYQPTETDKQHYTWTDAKGGEQKYQTPNYGIATGSLDRATSAIKKFMAQNADEYIEAHMKSANDIAHKAFQTAQAHRHLPLVERALDLWTGCRFIEEPWSITGSETLSLSKDPHPSSPYHDRIPVPPIVDLQIDLIVINNILQPELKQILRMLKTMLESSDPWTNWFEIYLAYFVLLHNVELTMAHDAWFVKRNNLKKKYSNKLLVETIMSGATTLLTCFHYAHQGFAPFSMPDLEETQKFAKDEREYLGDIRPKLKLVGGEHVQDPAKELFWTSQLHTPNWRPLVLAT